MPVLSSSSPGLAWCRMPTRYHKPETTWTVYYAMLRSCKAEGPLPTNQMLVLAFAVAVVLKTHCATLRSASPLAIKLCCAMPYCSSHILCYARLTYLNFAKVCHAAMLPTSCATTCDAEPLLETSNKAWVFPQSAFALCQVAQACQVGHQVKAVQCKESTLDSCCAAKARWTSLLSLASRSSWPIRAFDCCCPRSLCSWTTQPTPKESVTQI